MVALDQTARERQNRRITIACRERHSHHHRNVSKAAGHAAPFQDAIAFRAGGNCTS